MAVKKIAVKAEDRVELFLQIIDLLPEHSSGQKELAEMAGISQSTIYNWACGNTRAPRIDTICKVCRALGYELFLRKKQYLEVIK